MKLPDAAKEIAPGVYWLDGGSSNFYLCVEPEQITLIDSGMPKKESLVFALLDCLGRQPQELTRILITHADIDHAGSAAAVQAKTGARIVAGVQTAAHLQAGTSPEHLPWIAQLIVKWLFKYTAVPADVIDEVQDGDELPVLDGLHVLATPGHTLDHLSFFAPGAGVLFVGDALNTRNGRLQPTPPRITADREKATRSAMRLLALAPACIACGHGDPMQDHSAKDLMNAFNELRA